MSQMKRFVEATSLAWRWYFWRYGRGDTRSKAENKYQEIIEERVCEEDRSQITDGILITSKKLKSVLWGERYELLLRRKVIRIPISYCINQNEIVLSAITFFTNSNVWGRLSTLENSTT